MNCWEKLKAGTADEIDKVMCASRTAQVSDQLDRACVEFAEKINSLLKEYPDECELAGFNVIFFVTDKRAKSTGQPLIQCVYGTKGELQELCAKAQEAIK